MPVTVTYSCELCAKHHVIVYATPTAMPRDNRATLVPNGFEIVRPDLLVRTALSMTDHVLLCVDCNASWHTLQRELAVAGNSAIREGWRKAQLEAKGAVVALGEIVAEGS